MKKPTHDNMTEAKEVYIQLSFERYKRKLVLRFYLKSVSIDFSVATFL